MKTKKIFAVILSVTLVMSFATFTAAAAAFDDVPSNHPYRAAIDFCAENHFVLGVSDTAFMPDANLTRGQLAVIWCRTLHIMEENHSFTDVTGLRNYYDSAVIVLRSLGIFSGISAARFAPNDPITREQLAVLTTRTYRLGVADPEAYTQYADYASISDWARDGISSCINADILEGLYDGQNFEPQKPVTRAEVCKLIYNLSLPEYTVTIGTLSGGTITASPTKARPGTTISLTVTPDPGKQLKEGTLKYNDTVITGGTNFIMPAEDVTITAQFEDKPVTLESIAVTTFPTKMTYNEGDGLDLAGMVVTATYSDNTTAPVTGYTTDPANGATLSEGMITVTVSYTQGDVTRSTTFQVQVNAG